MKRTFLIIIIICFGTGILIAQDTLYVVKSGKLVMQRAISDIDSMTFIKPDLIDIDGNVYHTVTIGTQTWMVENLRVSRYRDGSVIPNIKDNNEWMTTNNGAYCYYNNDSTTNILYGKIYNWFVISDSRKIAPNGWHIPTLNEWQTLFNYVSSNINLNVGKALAASTDWLVSTEAGSVGNILSLNNSSGFSVLPAGARSWADGLFGGVGECAWFWTSTDYGSTAPYYYLLNSRNSFWQYNQFKRNGVSIRCVKD